MVRDSVCIAAGTLDNRLTYLVPGVEFPRSKTLETSKMTKSLLARTAHWSLAILAAQAALAGLVGGGILACVAYGRVLGAMRERRRRA